MEILKGIKFYCLTKLETYDKITHYKRIDQKEI